MSLQKFIVVTGGAGYIGSVVVNYLIDLRYKIIVIDNLSTGSLKLVNSEAHFYKCEIKNYKKLSNILKIYKNQISSIFHFAGSLSVSESQKKPLKYFNNNVIGTENVLKLCNLLGIKKFIFSSTCAVYGSPERQKISENSPTVPISNYGRTKLLAEKLVKEFSKKYKFKFAILRYFNVVGGENKNRSGPISGKTIFKVLCENLIKNLYKVNLYGNNYPTKDGSCIRDFIDVNDLAEIHVLSKLKLNRSKSFVLNCGYGEGYSIKEIIKAFSMYLRKNIFINVMPKRDGDVDAIYCDTRKLKKMFPNWKRKSTLLKSVASSIKWEKYIKNNFLNI
jgi:UDP-glucose 4-epimerase